MNTLTPEQLTHAAEVVGNRTYEGYPAPAHRLRLGQAGLYMSGSRLVVPDGPWHVAHHPNRLKKDPALLDPEVPTAENPMVSQALSDRWQASGLLLDQYGRPIHPNWRQLLGDERIGLPTGLGFFYRYAANATIDLIAYRNRLGARKKIAPPTEFLLIKRRIGKQWAAPGGFYDATDASPEAAARREAKEETGLADIGGTAELIIDDRPVGLRDTLHAWTENKVVLVHGDQEYLFDTPLEAMSDAEAAGWFTRQQIGQLAMFGSHLGYFEASAVRLAQLGLLR